MSRTATAQVVAGKLDVGPLPDAEVRGVADRYGVNKTRFWVEPLELPRLPRVERQPAAVRPQCRAPARAQLGRRPAGRAGTRAAVLRLAVDAPAAARISRLGHRRAPTALCRRAEPEQGPPARGRSSSGRGRSTSATGARARSGSARRELVRSALEAIGFKDGRHQAEGLQRRRPLHRDGQAEHRPRPRGGPRLVQRLSRPARAVRLRPQLLRRERARCRQVPRQARGRRETSRRGALARRSASSTSRS